MKLNYETVIVGETCILVPYRTAHVPKYHEWMLDPNLLEATGSEPLSIEEEYDMQQSWRDDPTKCTFIVLAKALVKEIPPCSNDSTPSFVEESLSAMVGDVNLFLSDFEDDSDHKDRPAASTSKDAAHPFQQAEIDIMVAEKGHQRLGIGREACLLMMQYGTLHLNIARFFCKINEANHASIRLFEDKLGFVQCNYAECFKQVELEQKADSNEALRHCLEAMGAPQELATFQCPIV